MQELELQLDPASQVTGMAVVQGTKVIFGADEHRPQQIKDALLSRRQLRQVGEIARPAIAKRDF